MKLVSNSADQPALQAKPLAPSHVSVIVGAYFVSGFCALLYQTAWQRLLGLFTGADVRSVTIVVAAYLAGLGLGSLVGGMVADRLDSRRAVRLFGLCNLGIAAFALAARLVFYDLLFLRLYALAAEPAALVAASVLSLLLPTTLMGLSLPLLSRALVRSLADAPRLIGRLEATNILGAAAGAMVGGWFIIGALGFDGASAFGAILSAGVGVTALVVSRAFPSGDGAPPAAAAGRTPPVLWGWCALVCASGFIAIGLQVVWFRVLSVPVESQAYTFATLVAIVLLGDGIGTAIGARVVGRAADPRRLFMLTQGLIVLYTLVSTLLLALAYSRLDPDTARFSMLSQETRSFGMFLLLSLGLPLAMMLPPNILIGLTLPFVQKAVQVRERDVGRRVGLLQVANLVGNVAGAALTGTVLLDWLGAAGTLVLFGAVGLAFALAALVGARPLARHAPPVALAAALVLAVMLFPSNARLWAWMHGDPAGAAIVAEDSTGVTVLAPGEGVTTLYAGGSSQGQIPFLDVHAVLGAVPALAHPSPREVMIIGVGSGGTPYAAGLRPETERVLAVELVGSQLPALRALAETPAGADLRALFADPRYDLAVGDGRRELALAGARFDLVQADAILPWKAGSGLLYSREFFEQVRGRLAPGGVMAQWTPTDRTRASFQAAFPYGVRVGNILVIGGNEPVAYDRQAILARLDDPRVRDHLARGGVDIERVRRFVVSQDVVFWGPETPRAGQLNTDLLPRDEYFLNR